MRTHLTGRTALGYGLVVAAVTMRSLNASISRTLLHGGLSALRLSELRSLGAWVLLRRDRRRRAPTPAAGGAP